MRCATVLLAVTVLSCAVAPQASAASVPTTVRGGLSATGAQPNGYTPLSDISRNGRWLAFDSYGQNIVAGDQVARDVYLRDTWTGVVTRLARTTGGAVGNAASAGPTISADGSRVAFISDATNLAGGTTNSSDDVYVYDRNTGALKRVSTNLTGGDADAAAREQAISEDGHWVVFDSAATDLVAGDTNGQTDIFRVNVDSGAIQLVSVGVSGAQSNGESRFPDVSGDGRYVTWRSTATNLVTGDANGQYDVFVRDMQTGTTERVSTTASGGEGNGLSTRPAITADGCEVAFLSASSNLVAGLPDGSQRVFVRDRCHANTTLVSLTGGGAPATAVTTTPQISDDGCRVGFVSTDATASGGISAGVVRDTCGALTSRFDIATNGTGGNAAVEFFSMSPGSGRYLSFGSAANNLVDGDTNTTADVFVRDQALQSPPVVDFDVAVDGMRASVDASRSSDADNGIASVAVSYGDGSPDQAGVLTSHDYKQGGSFTISVVVTDRDGLTTIQNRPVTITAPAGGGGAGPGGSGGSSGVPSGSTVLPGAQAGPATGGSVVSASGGGSGSLRLSKASLTATSFRVVRKGGSPGSGRGAYLVLTSSAAGSLRLTFERAVKGHRSGSKCSTSARRGRSCTLYRSAGSTSATLRKGTARIAVTGRVSGKALSPGSYRVKVVAEASDGSSSNTITLTLKIKR